MRISRHRAQPRFTFCPDALDALPGCLPHLGRLRTALLAQMNMSMFARRHNGQILNAIVQGVVIEVMNSLRARHEIAPKVLFHHQATFQDVAFVVVRMVGAMHPAIAKLINPEAAPPIPVGRAWGVGRGLARWRFDDLSSTFLGRMALDVSLVIANEGACRWMRAGVTPCRLTTSAQTDTREDLLGRRELLAHALMVAN